MKFRILIVFFTIFFILCQEDNIDNNEGKKKDNNIEISDSDEIDEIETENQESENTNEYIEISEDMLKNIELESIDFGGPLALSDFDMSLLLLCAYISHQALKNKYIESINQIAEKLNVSETKRIYDKIGAGFAQNCYEYIDDETVNKYITNLTYHNNFQWEEEFDNYTKLDINKYKFIFIKLKMFTNTNKPKLQKILSPQPLIVKGYNNLSRAMYYALLGIITEVISDKEKDKRQQLLQNPNGKIIHEKLDDPKIAKDIYDKIGRLYPDSSFNVVVLNLVGGEYQFANSRENTAYLSVASGNRVFMIFKYKE